MRVVLDTGVVVSAMLLPRSTPRRAVDAILRQGTLLISAATVSELDEVVRRPKFDPYIREEIRVEFLAALIRQAEVVDVTEAISACRDADDNKFLELAVGGAATHLVTGDGDLLALHPFRGVAIVSPKAFVDGCGAAAD